MSLALHNVTVSQGGTLHIRIHGLDMDVVESLATGQYAKESSVNRSLTAVEGLACKQVAVSIRTESGSLECYASSATKPATSADFAAQAERMRKEAA